ncbi:MAG TPA: hypothetical protein VJ982_01625 [Gemmatimonadota bacterium]|nr:hypothetical protein [Gemmatimonadota bacterium]
MSLAWVLVAGIGGFVFTASLRFLGNLIAEAYNGLSEGIERVQGRIESLDARISSTHSAPKSKEDYRRERIARLKQFARDFDWENDNILEAPEWSEIRSIISASVVEEFEAGISIQPVFAVGRPTTEKSKILDALADVERLWMLI